MWNIFTVLFINPITNILVACYKLFEYLHIPFPLGFAIILLTIIIRLILFPFVASQIKASSKMQKVAPHMATIREKHKEDKKRQQEEMMKLYKEHGINPAAGCLPVIIQLPIIWSLYNVLTHIVGVTGTSAINKINAILYSPALRIDPRMWDTSFFGASLGMSPQHLLSQSPLLLLVPVITGLTQFILSKMMLPDTSSEKVVAKVDEKKVKKNEDFAQAFQTQSLYIFPVMIGFFSYSLPIGLSLYWNTFTLFGILQQYLVTGWGGMNPWIKKLTPSK